MGAKSAGIGEDRLTARQRAFVLEYMVDLCGKSAAIRAGYAPTYADREAAGLLGLPKVQAALEEQLAAREMRTRITADRVLAEIGKIALADIGQMFDETGEVRSIKDMPPDLRAAVASFEVETSERGEGAILNTAKVRMSDKMAALTLLCRHMSLLNDKLEVTAKVDAAQSILAARQRLRKARGADKPADEGTE